jgi:hypothetical protein
VKEEETFQQQAPVGVEVQLGVYQRALLFVLFITESTSSLFCVYQRALREEKYVRRNTVFI